MATGNDYGREEDYTYCIACGRKTLYGDIRLNGVCCNCDNTEKCSYCGDSFDEKELNKDGLCERCLDEIELIVILPHTANAKQ